MNFNDYLKLHKLGYFNQAEKGYRSLLKQKNQFMLGSKKLKFFSHQMNLLSFILIIQEKN